MASAPATKPTATHWSVFRRGRFIQRSTERPDRRRQEPSVKGLDLVELLERQLRPALVSKFHPIEITSGAVRASSIATRPVAGCSARPNTNRDKPTSAAIPAITSNAYRRPDAAAEKSVGWFSLTFSSGTRAVRGSCWRCGREFRLTLMPRPIAAYRREVAERGAEAPLRETHFGPN